MAKKPAPQPDLFDWASQAPRRPTLREIGEALKKLFEKTETP
jgi:hypothetical protein